MTQGTIEACYHCDFKLYPEFMYPPVSTTTSVLYFISLSELFLYILFTHIDAFNYFYKSM